MKPLILALVLLVVPAHAAHAIPIQVVFDFAGGIDVSYNGGAEAPSGPLVFTGSLDSTTADLEPDNLRGVFALDSLYVTAPSLGLFDVEVVTPGHFMSFANGMGLRFAGFFDEIGWNQPPGGFALMGDMNDLSTLPLPTVAAMVSTFFGANITLANGDTLSGNVGSGGPDGQFSAIAVPEPTVGLLVGLGLGLAGRLQDAGAKRGVSRPGGASTGRSPAR